MGCTNSIQCSDNNAECSSTDSKCRCTAAFYDNDLDDTDTDGTCVSSKSVIYTRVFITLVFKQCYFCNIIEI